MRIADATGLALLSPEVLTFALHGGYLHKPSDRFIWYYDGMQFMNHGATPFANIGLGHWPALAEDHCIALRDIAPGEELLEDYSFWSNGGVQPGHWLHRLYMEFCPGHLAFLSRLDTFREAA